MGALLTRWLKILGATIGILIGLTLVIGLLFWLWLPDLCANSIVAELPAPGGKAKVVVFTRDCGATTDFSTQVSVLGPHDTLSNTAGNVFVAERDHGRSPVGPGGGPDIQASWLSENQLRIEHHSLARVFKAEPLWKGIKIEYVQVKQNG